jgi:hypothetical protein
MINSIKIMAIVGLFSTTAWAREEITLPEVFTKYDRAYQRLGGDNNHLAKIYARSANVGPFRKNLPKAQFRRLKVDQYFSVIKRCVFMQRGAYGRHLSNNIANRLSRMFLQSMIRDWIVSPALYYVSPLQLELVNNRCGLLIVSPLKNEAILIQGVSFD